MIEPENFVFSDWITVRVGVSEEKEQESENIFTLVKLLQSKTRLQFWHSVFHSVRLLRLGGKLIIPLPFDQTKW